MKRLLEFLIAGALAALLVGCSGDSASSEPETGLKSKDKFEFSGDEKASTSGGQTSSDTASADN